MNKEEKNNKIKQSLKQTKLRHNFMSCKVFEIKVVYSKLSKAQIQDINNCFKEAKWLRNNIISDISGANRNAKTVLVKVGDHFEEKTLSYLGSQIKQDIYDNVKSEIYGLSIKRKHGYKVGKLKYKSYCNMLPLRQFGTTYKIDFDKNRIKVQNIKKSFYVRGLKQISQDSDITNAKLVRKASGLYFYITCYVKPKEYALTNKQVGIDFGIENNLNFSDERDPFNVSIKESKNIKYLSRKINKCWINNNKLHSNNNYKRKHKLQKAYERINNQKADKAHKIVNTLLNEYDFIAIQDEMLSNWHSGLFGKQIQHSCMGLIKAELKNSSKVHVISRTYPSTKICPICGKLNSHPLSKRDYDCLYCGYHNNSRDKKSAKSILDEALYQVSLEQRAKSLVEAESSTVNGSTVDSKFPPMTQEAQVL